MQWMRLLIGSRSELVLVAFLVCVLLVLFTPIPAGLLDFLLISNFGFGLIILFLTLYMDKPLSFSTFPTLILIATLFRLSLNVAATRLILSDAHAGQVINAIGEYAVRGNYVIGLVVFFILIVVQFVVVTSGAQRVAEVAARFVLDSMPGKQMSIDADLNMGLIDEQQAQERRRNIEREANFYGAMDGASKFVKGDAIAGILIILINVVGGLAVGVAQKGMSWAEALHTYTLLTVGDGIVTQIPALVISTATGIIVTRAATDAKFGEEIAAQVTKYPGTLVVVAMGILAMLLLPGMPAGPIFLTFAILGLVAYWGVRRYMLATAEVSDASILGEQTADVERTSSTQPEALEILLGADAAKTVGGYSALMMEKVKAFRDQFALESGVLVPAVSVRQGDQLRADGYQVRLWGARLGDGVLLAGRHLVIGPAERLGKLDGVKTKEPTYGLPAVWVEDAVAESLEGVTVVEPVAVLLTHFTELVRRNASELLGRRELEQLCEQLKRHQPGLYEELIPSILSMGDVQKVLRCLVAEKVSIRNLECIFEVLCDIGRTIKSPELLAEAVRRQLGREICDALANDSNELSVITLDPGVEKVLQRAFKENDGARSLALEPEFMERLLKSLSKLAEQMMAKGRKPVLMCSPEVRLQVRRLIERALPALHVISFSEVPASLAVASAGVAQA